MKKFYITLTFSLILSLFVLPQGNIAQENSQAAEEIGIQDPQLEKRADHSVEVAKFYLKQRKAYKAAIERLEEIFEIYPQYSHVDQVLFLLGESYFGLKKPEEAKKYYGKLTKEYPKSTYLKLAQKQLMKLNQE